MSPEETKKTVDELAASLLAPRFAPPVAGERPAPPRSAPDIPGQGLVHGVGYGIPPQGGKATRLIFASPAPQCVLDALAAKYAKRGKPVKIVASGPIVGLQSLAVSIGADAAPNYNAPPFYAGTLTGIVTANGTNWLLGCNHVVSFNGRVPTGSPVRNPGLVDDFAGGPAIGSLSDTVLLAAQPSSNQVDCALAQAAAARPAAPASMQPFSGNLNGQAVTKNGRITGITSSTISVPYFAGTIHFSFGSFDFTDLVGNYGPESFARPGDSGSLVEAVNPPATPTALGLLMARAYTFDANNNVSGFLYLSCRFDLVLNKAAAALGVPSVVFSPVA